MGQENVTVRPVWSETAEAMALHVYAEEQFFNSKLWCNLVGVPHPSGYFFMTEKKKRTNAFGEEWGLGRDQFKRRD